jgi:hypothetical protein
VNRQLPHLRNPGQGVNRKRPHLRNPGQGIEGGTAAPAPGRPGAGREPEAPAVTAARLAWLNAYLGYFAARLRGVRVCCGDWSRVCGPSVTFRHGPTGVFLDPPYADTAKRTKNLYAQDCERVAHDVRAWAVGQGVNPLMRIVVSGYQGEHKFPADWSVVEWEAAGGYGLIGGDEDGVGRANRKRERLWLSPHCVRKGDSPDLFSAVEDTALARLRACHGVGSLFDPGAVP